jgi:hypothetical protein
VTDLCFLLLGNGGSEKLGGSEGGDSGQFWWEK